MTALPILHHPPVGPLDGFALDAATWGDCLLELLLWLDTQGLPYPAEDGPEPAITVERYRAPDGYMPAAPLRPGEGPPLVVTVAFPTGELYRAELAWRTSYPPGQWPWQLVEA